MYHHLQRRIGFNTVNPSLSTGKDYPVHALMMNRMPVLEMGLGKSLGHQGWISKYLPRFDGAGIQYFTSGSYMRQSFSPKCFFFPGSCGDDTDECDNGAVEDHQCEHFENVNFISNR